jgi:small-conductance mechanosensitive channel
VRKHWSLLSFFPTRTKEVGSSNYHCGSSGQMEDSVGSLATNDVMQFMSIIDCLLLKISTCSPLLLIRWGAFQVQICFLQWANLIRSSLKKTMKLWRLPNIESRIPSLWPRYIGERRTTFAKAYGIQLRCYWEHFGERMGNLKHILKFWWEPIGNLSET